MQIIKDWGAGLITISVVSALILLLTPKGSSEKYVKTAVSVVLLVTIIRPIISLMFSDKDVLDPISFSESVDSVDGSESELALVFKKGLEDRIMNMLKEHNLAIDSVKSDVAVNDKYEIYINEVVVYMEEKYYADKDTVLKIIKDEFGVIARTEVSG